MREDIKQDYGEMKTQKIRVGIEGGKDKQAVYSRVQWKNNKFGNKEGTKSEQMKNRGKKMEKRKYRV